MDKKTFIKLFKIKQSVALKMYLYDEERPKYTNEIIIGTKTFLNSVNSIPDIFFTLVPDNLEFQVLRTTETCSIRLSFCSIIINDSINISFHIRKHNEDWNAGCDFVGPTIIQGKHKTELTNKIYKYMMVCL